MGVRARYRRVGMARRFRGLGRQLHTVRKARQQPATIPVRARARQNGPMPRQSLAVRRRQSLGQNRRTSTTFGATADQRTVDLGRWHEHCGGTGSYGTLVSRRGNLPPAYQCDQLGGQRRGLLALWRAQLNSSGGYLAVFNDLWSYNLTRLWTWVGGSYTPTPRACTVRRDGIHR